MTRYWRAVLPAALVALMSACATAPHVGPLPLITPPSTAVPKPKSVVKAVIPSAIQAPDIWSKLRQSFAMADCDADAGILAWAHRYTQDPQHFEATLRDAMPRLVYVQQVAARHDVAGEFVLLPWVESHYQPVTSRHYQHAAGMWQIVPATARTMGLEVSRSYDARFSVPAATDGVMTLLERYYRDLHDWRLVDYAYNAGEFAVQRVLKQHGMPPAEPVIPNLPVPRITREHLTKLLAIACVIREPARFHVDLPLLPPSKRLETVTVKHPMRLEKVAKYAGMPLHKLKHLNSAFRDGRITAAHTPTRLLLPRQHARQWHRHVELQNARDADLIAGVTPQPLPLPSLPSTGNDPSPGQREHAAPLASSAPPPIRRHTVRRGETLWVIARRYAVSVRQIEHWNHLRGHTIKPGQVLKVSAPQ
ncbi:LysM peptidoglycan-binding domain-containing protein [Dyella sp. A6]|uniref:LysM peptidoglycan-binding domain-containing protein n=1 Tax=Dyella aluminiiresistens TaxID=3069105 RepID=UPI002E783DA9|nr:LysM peptidoglycan-binding domain-containing protein [Dyella sp. A6]